MGDLAVDTRLDVVERSEGSGRYLAELSRDWEIWGPNGGYLAVILLRAAGAQSRFSRPASFTCHYLGVAEFAPVDVSVTTLRSGRRSESLRVSMTQGGAPVAEALAWLVDEIDGPRHDWSAPPDVPPPEDVPTVEERMANEAAEPARPPYPFWQNLEFRPLRWLTPAEWERREAGEPVSEACFRFRPTATFDDPLVDAGRAALLIDTMMWPAASRAHPNDVGFIAPSVDVSVQFHRLAREVEFLLCRSVAPIAADGLVGAIATVWSPDARLLASGGQQMLWRPVAPPRPS